MSKNITYYNNLKLYEEHAEEIKQYTPLLGEERCKRLIRSGRDLSEFTARFLKNNNKQKELQEKREKREKNKALLLQYIKDYPDMPLYKLKEAARLNIIPKKYTSKENILEEILSKVNCIIDKLDIK